MAECANSEPKYPIYTGPHFMCSDCRTMFISEEFLKKHQKKCIYRKLHLILKMKFQLRRNTSVDDHRTKNENTEDYFCEKCLSGFLSLSDFESHIQEGHSEEVLFSSHLSDRKYDSETKSEPAIAMIPQSEKASKVTLHNRYNATKTSLNCPNDQGKLNSKQTNQYLVTHSNNIHTGQNPFVCDHCDKSFSYKSILKSHLLMHTGEKPFVCDQCDKRFSHKCNLKNHLLIHTGDKPFVCDQCEKGFSQMVHLKTHLLFHTGQKPFVCDHCEKSFSVKSALKRHLIIHTGDKPFVCDHCGKGFSRKGDLKKHLLIHTSEKTFVCDYCDKGFFQISNLNKHLPIHTGDRPYVCDHCKKGFSEKGNLKSHILIHHTGERSFVCYQCEKSFSHKGCLKNHMKIHS